MRFDLEIKEAALQDAGTIGALHVECWQDAYSGLLPADYLKGLSASVSAEKIRFVMAQEKPPFHYFLTTIGEVPAGFIALGKSRDEDRIFSGEISAMYLKARWWGEGYGTSLMKFSLEELRQRGYDEIILWVLKENERAVSFYERQGFISDGAEKSVDFIEAKKVIRYRKQFLKG